VYTQFSKGFITKVSSRFWRQRRAWRQ